MNDKEISLWINNYEELYKLWKMSKLSMKEFIKRYKVQIDNYINERLGKKPSSHTQAITRSYPYLPYSTNPINNPVWLAPLLWLGGGAGAAFLLSSGIKRPGESTASIARALLIGAPYLTGAYFGYKASDTLPPKMKRYGQLVSLALAVIGTMHVAKEFKEIREESSAGPSVKPPIVSTPTSHLMLKVGIRDFIYPTGPNDRVNRWATEIKFKVYNNYSTPQKIYRLIQIKSIDSEDFKSFGPVEEIIPVGQTILGEWIEPLMLGVSKVEIIASIFEDKKMTNLISSLRSFNTLW